MALGASFSVAVCPACTLALVVLLGIGAGVGSSLFGGLLLLAFSVGRTVPVVLRASAMGWLEGRGGLRRSQRALEIAAGLVLILSGLYMLNAYFFFVPGWRLRTRGKFGFLTAVLCSPQRVLSHDQVLE